MCCVESEVADGVLQPLPASHVNRRNLSNESAFDESGQSTGRHQPNGAIAVSMRRLRCARLTRGISRERDQACTACDWHDLSFRSLHRRLTPFYRRLGVGLIAVPISSRSDALYTYIQLPVQPPGARSPASSEQLRVSAVAYLRAMRNTYSPRTQMLSRSLVWRPSCSCGTASQKAM